SLSTRSKHRRLVQQLPLCNALEAKDLRINQISCSFEDQIRDNLACCRRMHYAVSAEAIGEEEARHISHWTEDRMMIRAHLVKAWRCPVGIQCQILEAGHTIGGARKDLLDERRFEVGLVTWRFLRIIPCQQKSPSFRTEVEAVRHVDHHRRLMREIIERFRRD